MIAIIGEMIPSFRKDGNGYVFSYTGIGYEWVEKLRRRGEKVLFLSPIPRGSIGKKICDELTEMGVFYDPDMLVSVNPPVKIDDEYIIRSSSMFTIDTEKLTDAFSYFSDIKSVVVSSAVLAANPSASAVLDALSFLSPLPEIAVDKSLPEEEIVNNDILERILNGFRAIPGCLITDDKEEILNKIS